MHPRRIEDRLEGSMIAMPNFTAGNENHKWGRGDRDTTVGKELSDLFYCVAINRSLNSNEGVKRKEWKKKRGAKRRSDRLVKHVH